MKLIRTGVSLKADHNRVILRPFVIPAEERIRKILRRILSLTEEEAAAELQQILKDFEWRHKNLKRFFLRRFEDVRNYLPGNETISEDRKLLIGSYFSMEYSVESASLFNPSIVRHPDQTGLPEGSKKFIISLRATGEGHISSIEFRTGIIDKENNISLDTPGRFVVLPDEIRDLGNFNYEIKFSADSELSERIIFPYSPIESNGIEDARFVEFKEKDKSFTYYAVYTGYDGRSIVPRILETKDFLHFNIKSLTGTEVVNKGFALFPRMINGQYAMLSRQDNENNFIMFSDDLCSWNSKKIILEPKFSWEFIQIGNCGSPVETKEGWVVLSHGVGAMRKYVIGVFLLDKENPERVIGRLNEPLISPLEYEREGYVPNVVYSCGSLISGDELIIPYAMSDFATGFAKVNLNDLLNELTSSKNKL
jgi:predicted GH43/DUF377 family glycosyl hydrolase